MTDEFIYFLVGGLAILAALFLVAGVQFTGYAMQNSFYGLGSPVFVGTTSVENVETLYASFDANNYLQTIVYDMGSREVRNGLLFGESSVKLNVSADSIFVSFDVTRTNEYGTLMIKEDGQTVVEKQLIAGHYEFSLGPAHEIEVAAASSDWRLWAPNLYDLANLRIAASNYPREISTYTFKLSDIASIETVRMDMNLRENAGTFIVKLNGNVIYDGAMNPVQTLYIDKSQLENLNILTFAAEPDSRFAGRATIAITSAAVQEKTLTAVINMTQDEYNRFSSGSIAFDVVDVFSPGGYSVKIVNNNQTLVNEYVKLEKGYFELTLKKDSLRPGLNVFVVEPLDGASFNVQSLTTRL